MISRKSDVLPAVQRQYATCRAFTAQVERRLSRIDCRKAVADVSYNVEFVRDKKLVIQGKTCPVDAPGESETAFEVVMEDGRVRVVDGKECHDLQHLGELHRAAGAFTAIDSEHIFWLLPEQAPRGRHRVKTEVRCVSTRDISIENEDICESAPYEIAYFVTVWNKRIQQLKEYCVGTDLLVKYGIKYAFEANVLWDMTCECSIVPPQ